MSTMYSILFIEYRHCTLSIYITDQVYGEPLYVDESDQAYGEPYIWTSQIRSTAIPSTVQYWTWLVCGSLILCWI